MSDHHAAFASLSPRLLARKGAAKPAMRRQDTSKFINGGGISVPTDDLGWNDWGQDHGAEAKSVEPKAVPPKNGEVAARPVQVASQPVALTERDMPEVLRQIEQIAWRINRAVPSAPVSKSEGRRAAFTLRLDAERHFRLKMAGVVLNRSAQVLVTEALDKYLSEIPEVAQVQSIAAKRR